MKLSIVIPIYNEQDNVRLTYDAILRVCDPLDCELEIVYVDDGSNDDSNPLIRALAAKDDRVKLVEFRRNFGQTAAMHAGIQTATGDVIATIDGDLQNDPADIPMMLDKLEEGYDLVHGWRKQRQDQFVSRRLPSLIANWLISKVTRFPVRDLGCTLKVMRSEVAKELLLQGEMHRFIPILAHWRGARCVEVVTRHHPRRFGESKYGIGRTFHVILDLITVKYLTQFSPNPMKMFGGLGLLCITAGGFSGLATIGMKLFGEVDMTGNPLLLLTAFAIMVGIQFLVLGLLGEVSARTFFATQQKEPYVIREVVNYEAANEPEAPPIHRAA